MWHVMLFFCKKEEKILCKSNFSEKLPDFEEFSKGGDSVLEEK